jgi:hypothetical protein
MYAIQARCGSRVSEWSGAASIRFGKEMPRAVKIAA